VNDKFRTVLAVLREPENIITIIGTVVAAILAYSGIRNNDVQQALTAIITVLGTLAVAQIIAGYESSKARETIERIESLLHSFASPPNPPLRLRTEIVSLQKRAKNAKDILIIARTAIMVLRQTEFFKERIRQGATIRLAVVNPDNSAVIEALGPLAETSKEGVIADMQGTIGLVCRLREQTSNPEQIQVRVFDYVQTLSMVMVDGHLPTGSIIVEMIPYQVGPSSRPHLLLTAKDNPMWYAYFRDICEAIWRDAEPSSRYFG
jgi:hypothetical protein